MDTYDLIAKAINERLQVHAVYDGHVRELCPHTLGIKDGVRQCLFYQFGGMTSKGKLPADPTQRWRCMEISELRSVTLRAGPWHSAANYTEEQTCIDEILIAV